MEYLTHELAHRAWDLIQEIEALGGMAKAIETGLPKMKSEEAAARKQGRIDSKKDVIVGVNKYKLDQEDPIDILEVDNSAVRQAQISRLEQLRARRDNTSVQEALDRLTEAVKNGEDNLLELSVEAARRRATLGEISFAIEKVCGRYHAVIRSISGIYSSESTTDENFRIARKLCKQFAEQQGRQPRIMIAKMGQEGHDRGAKVVSTGYADMGFDADMRPQFQPPEDAAKRAVA